MFTIAGETFSSYLTHNIKETTRAYERRPKKEDMKDNQSKTHYENSN